jgi:N-methylhydantoinase B
VSRKTWSHPHYQTEALSHMLENILAEIDVGTAALVLTDARPLHVHTVHPADTATLPQAAALCFQYFQLKDGDVAICNDPFAGGTRLSDITLVMGVTFESIGNATDVLLAVRLRFDSKISVRGSLDDEGIRIPPMPIVNGGQLNRDVLSAMSAAPNAPADLSSRIETALSEMQVTRAQLKLAGRDPQSELRKANFKRYFNDCHEIAIQLLHRMPLGESLVTKTFETGETTKLRLEIVENKAIFDFTGTESSKNIQLTDLATLGACFHFLQAALGQKLPANAGVLSCLELRAPVRTWVNAQAPAATARGVSDGVAFLGAIGLKAFTKLSKPHRAGSSSFGTGHVQFAFANAFVSDSTPGGCGASEERSGIDGINTWLTCDQQKSIEEMERLAPLRVRSVLIRSNSAGRGKWAGGNGLVKTYELTQPATVAWAFEQVKQKPDGIEGGKPALQSEIQLQRSGSEEKEELPSLGSSNLGAGDILRVYSAGGGGYGAPEEV